MGGWPCGVKGCADARARAAAAAGAAEALKDCGQQAAAETHAATRRHLHKLKLHATTIWVPRDGQANLCRLQSCPSPTPGLVLAKTPVPNRWNCKARGHVLSSSPTYARLLAYHLGLT